jgi:hypothetical protein
LASTKFLLDANVSVHIFRRLYSCIFFCILIKYVPIICATPYLSTLTLLSTPHST